MKGKICIPKKFTLLVLFVSFLATGAVYLSNYLIKKQSTVKTRAEVVEENLSAPDSASNGVSSENNEFPYYVRVSINQDGNMVACGGSLISKEYVLTAARCVSDQDISNIFVVIGQNHIDSQMNAQFSSGVNKIIVREDFKAPLADSYGRAYSNDIALLHLIKPAIGVPFISIPDPTLDRNKDSVVNEYDYPEKAYIGEPVTMVNFFRLRGVRRYMFWKLDLIKSKASISDYPGRAIDRFAVKDVCTWGEMGGPLIMAINEKPQVVGIAIAGNQCDEHFIFASVTNFSKWIHEATKIKEVRNKDEEKVENESGIKYESGLRYSTTEHNVFPSQSSQKSLCTENKSIVDCKTKGVFCKWSDSCNRCNVRETPESEGCT